ncbi:serine protease [Kordiimonas sp. SCSIO 12610]|uniref:trypsin-like serine peptidase n=1 Tax=Kordiimonas sp. SCSIO 12610 TaxID=2829597 RepID=UPI00210DADCD|nr:trypsin-like serine protease [Kordiimonas sp. SCSIO 12610]UTW54486.1 trypsin-like serine protease [Kordiimonas sp. SCSIO 12610]
MNDIVIPTKAEEPFHQQSKAIAHFDENRITVNAREYPFSAIGRLNGAGIDRRSHCTATLITPKHILTAAHCLYFKARKRWFLPNELHFLAGYDRGDFIAHGRIASIRAKGCYDPNQPLNDRNIEGDWAILTLTQNLSIKPLPLIGIPKSKTDKRFLQSGYHKQRQHVQTSNPTCRIEHEIGALLFHDCMLAPGDSGSPILYEADGNYSVVALNSAAIQHKKGKGKGLALSAHLFKDYLEDHPIPKDTVQ